MQQTSNTFLDNADAALADKASAHRRDLMGFFSRAAKHEAINIRVKINDPFQRVIPVSFFYHIIHVQNIFCTTIFPANGNFNRVAHIPLGNLGHFPGHCRGKKPGSFL